MSVIQIALAWVLQQAEVFAIPKASSVAHVKANRAAADIELSADELAKIDSQFKPPKAKRSLEML
jgi:aryl-alcohol dehydrogenase-like predicted oxidoreductase